MPSVTSRSTAMGVVGCPGLGTPERLRAMSARPFGMRGSSGTSAATGRTARAIPAAAATRSRRRPPTRSDARGRGGRRGVIARPYAVRLHAATGAKRRPSPCGNRGKKGTKKEPERVAQLELTLSVYHLAPPLVYLWLHIVTSVPHLNGVKQRGSARGATLGYVQSAAQGGARLSAGQEDGRASGCTPGKKSGTLRASLRGECPRTKK